MLHSHPEDAIESEYDPEEFARVRDGDHMIAAFEETSAKERA